MGVSAWGCRWRWVTRVTGTTDLEGSFPPIPLPTSPIPPHTTPLPPLLLTPTTRYVPPAHPNTPFPPLSHLPLSNSLHSFAPPLTSPTPSTSYFLLSSHPFLLWGDITHPTPYHPGGFWGSLTPSQPIARTLDLLPIGGVWVVPTNACIDGNLPVFVFVHFLGRFPMVCASALTQPLALSSLFIF